MNFRELLEKTDEYVILNLGDKGRVGIEFDLDTDVALVYTKRAAEKRAKLHNSKPALINDYKKEVVHVNDALNKITDSKSEERFRKLMGSL